ncbi:MAG TPA: alpha-glucan family phosphorylase [Trueperaceae bacterium]|nr:alpha-glucan family phosphorylase [Trueperaceae bacterium]
MNIVGHITVLPNLPERIGRLLELAHNMYWTWQPDARRLFRELDSDAWEKSNHDPVVVLHEVDQQRLEAASVDATYLDSYDAVLARFDAYLASTGWFERTYPATPGAKRDLFAYFCAEYGWHESVALYSGGLGVLAGDHTKAASDLGVPLVAVGLYYPEGYFHQRVAADGRQEAVYTRTDAADMPFTLNVDETGAPVVISVHMFGRDVRVQSWRGTVGKVEVVLLDVDFAANQPEDRRTLLRLYGGDQRTRIAQEMILGIGGVRMLRALGLDPSNWHMNEGHSAFMALERCRELVEAGLTFEQAREVVAANTNFTVHTPVAAGNDAFTFDLINQCFGGFWGSLGLKQNEFHDLGRADHGWGPVFSMPALALRFASGRNGVAELHGDTSRRIWSTLWPEVPVAEVPIGHVTNGVHLSSWMAPVIQELITDTLGPAWRDAPDEESQWQRFAAVDPAALWRARQSLKEQSLRFLRRRLQRQLSRHEVSPTVLKASAGLFDPTALTIGFARRFASYKRATLIFRDLDRLHAILGDEERPVQLVFAGKAHPADQPGQALIAQIHTLSQDPRFAGRVLFVEDYDMAIGRALTRGVDVWLNNPRRPLEASGTSGQKASMNGVLNLSILDGWWPEGFDGVNGWAIGGGRNYADDERADAADADSLYALLEREVVPLFYDRVPAASGESLPLGWLERSADAIATLTPKFNAQRMVKEYVERYYVPGSRREAVIIADDHAAAKYLAAWRERITAAWQGLYLSASPAEDGLIRSGDEIEIDAVLNPRGLSIDDVRVEVVYSRAEDQLQDGLRTVAMEHVNGYPDGGFHFRARFVPELSGHLVYGVRAYAYNDLLASPFDAQSIRWA